MAKEKEIKLKVGELTSRDEYGKGIARISSNAMKKLGIKEGDVIEIEGDNKTGVIAVRPYPSDAGLEIIRIDGLVRRNAGTGIGDMIKVRRADVKEAKKVVLAPARKGIILKANPRVMKKKFYMRPMTRGDIVVPSSVVNKRDSFDSLFEDFFKDFGIGMGGTPFSGLGSQAKLVVVDAKPKGIVRIGEATDLKVKQKAVKTLEQKKIPTVTYEDIGGLHEEIKKIREMIEYPMRHPELFERLGIEPPKGVLLHGPPGTGKTLLAKAVANEAGANFLVINGPEVMCVAPKTPLLTEKGIKTAQQIYTHAEENGKLVEETSDRKTFKVNPIGVKSLNGNLKIEDDEITEVTKLEDKKSVTIETEEGTELIVSKNQPFATLEGGELVWKRADGLRENDYIASVERIRGDDFDKVNLLKNLNSQYTIVKLENGEEMRLKELDEEERSLVKEIKFSSLKSNDDRANWLKLPFIDKDFMKLLGLIFADGHLAKRKDAIYIASEDERMKKRLVQIISSKFGLNGKSVKTRKDRIEIYSRTLIEILENGFEVPCGNKARTMRVPNCLFNMSEDMLTSFISGYFEGDGTVSYTGKYPTPRFYSKSFNFLKDLQSILQSKLQIPGRVVDWKTKYGDLFALKIKGNDGRKRFMEIIKDSNKVKGYKLSNKPLGENVIPGASELLKRAKKKLDVSYGKDIKESSIEPYVSGREPLTKRKAKEIHSLLSEFGETEELKKIERIIDSDIRFTKVRRVERRSGGIFYDFGVKKNSNFLGGEPFIPLHNSKWYGQSEKNLRKVFEEAKKDAPSIIFIDEIDSLAPKREETKGEVERRVVSQLLTLMDGLKARGKVIVIAATNRVNAVDPALRRPGRFDREVVIGVPNKNGRKEILEIHTRNMPLSKDVDLGALSERTHGFVGADLEALAKESAMHVLRRIMPEMSSLDEAKEIPEETLKKLKVIKDDFEYAMKIVQPSAMREVLVEIPSVKWKDVGGLGDVKEKLKETVEWPLKYPDSFEKLGIKPPKGLLLYGPPGTGKTLLARAVANESNANFISVKGPGLLSKWVGESEKHMREVFKKAKQASPSIIFFDEIDALAKMRGSRGGGGSEVGNRVVSQLLGEMSGLEELHDVVVIAATNRPDIIDPALLRPGRFDRQILVPEPDEEARERIFEIHTESMPLDKKVNLKKLAKKTEGYSGADIEAVCREAALNSMREDRKAKKVEMKHFKEALDQIGASLSDEVKKYYKDIDLRKRKKAEKEREVGYVG